jgi:hypothetical protein
MVARSCEDRGMAQVVVEDERTEPQPLGCHRDRREHGDGRELGLEVVVDREVPVPDRLRSAGALDERPPILQPAGADEEPERLHRAAVPDADAFFVRRAARPGSRGSVRRRRCRR